MSLKTLRPTFEIQGVPMFHASVRKTLLGLAISASAVLSVTGSAQAAVYKGAWDPAYGEPFNDPGQVLGWSGTAFWNVPDTCLTGNGTFTLTPASCSGMSVRSAEVNFYNVSSNPSNILETLVFNPEGVRVDGMTFNGSTLTAVTTDFFDRVQASAPIAGSGKYDFSLRFDGSRVQLYHLWRGTLPEDTTSNLARLLSYGDGGHDDHEGECSDKQGKKDKEGGKGDDEGSRDGRNGDHDEDDDDDEGGDDCKPRLEVCPWQPGDNLNNQYCGFSSDSPKVTFTLQGQEASQVPEPPTYALLLAGLGIAGFLAKRRRR